MLHQPIDLVSEEPPYQGVAMEIVGMEYRVV
jgi:hypothetical protein